MGKHAGSLIYITTFLVLMLSYRVSIASTSLQSSDIHSETDSLVNLAQEHHIWAARNYKVAGLLDSVIVRAKLALEIREKLWKEDPNIDLGKSYHNLGTFLKIKGDYKQAKVYLKEAVSTFTKLEHERVLRSLLELGKIYKQEGDFVSAKDYFNLVIQIAEEKNNHQKIRAAVVDLGSIYLEAFQDSLGILTMEKYIDYFDVDNQDDKDNIGRYYNNLASSYMRKDKFDKAIVTYQTASKLDKSNYKTQGQIYLNLAIPFRLKEMYKECYGALKKGKELAYQSKEPEIMSFSHKSMAKYHEAKSEFELALKEYQAAIKIMVPSFTPKDHFVNPSKGDLSLVVNKMYLLSFLTDKVKVLIDLGKDEYRDEIIGLFRLGDLVIDDIRSDHFINETKLYWRSLAFPFYEKALKYCHEVKANEDGFYFFEKSKSVLLLEGYSFNDAISKTIEKDKNRYQYLKKMLDEPKKESFEIVDGKVNAQRNFENFIDSLSVRYPQLFKGYKDLFLLSLKEFQEEFVNDSSLVFIHYFFGKDDVFAFGVGVEEFTFLNLGPASQIDSMITNLKHFFYHPAQIDNDFDSYQKVSKGLFNRLLKPIVKDSHKEIVISPDGPISSIPFESLISSNSKGEMKYVVEEKIIRYSFSGSILSNMQDSGHRGDYDVLSFMPLSGDENMKKVNFSGVHKNDFEEGKSKGLRVKYNLGDQAISESLFSMDERLPILHFSSHGFEDGEGDPKILLHESSISLSDLYTSSLPSDMVFLSACRTNLGKNSYGEGIQSMARGFTFAGANSVISSLWNVVADPNSMIVRRFYENLSLGQTKHLALHNAKLSYLQDTEVPLFEKSPYYWAGLVYYGESDHILKPKRIRSSNRMIFYLGISLILILAMVGFRKYQNKH